MTDDVIQGGRRRGPKSRTDMTRARALKSPRLVRVSPVRVEDSAMSYYVQWLLVAEM